MSTSTASRHPFPCRQVVMVGLQLPENGGGGTFVEVLSKALTNIGVRVEHVSLSEGTRRASFPTTTLNLGDLGRAPSLRGRQSLVASAIALPRWATTHLRHHFTLRKMRRHFRSMPQDSLIIFIDARAKAILNASGFRRSPNGPLLVGMHHSNYTRLRPDLVPIVQAAYSDVDAFVGLSRADAEKFETDTGVVSVAIPNPAPTIEVPCKAREGRAVVLARLSPEKQVDKIIHAFSVVKRRPGFQAWQLDIYGTGSEEQKVREAAASTGLGDQVRVLGRTDDVSGALAGASLNLLGSLVEGMPMVILEAASAGVPTLAYTVSPSISEFLSGDAGYPVPEGDEAAFVETLAAAMSDHSDLQRRGELARTKLEAFSPEATLGRWARLVELCLSRRQAKVAAQH